MLAPDVYPCRVINIKTPYELIVDAISGDIPTHLLAGLPKKWEKIGDILILRISEPLRRYRERIAEVYAHYLKCRSVLQEEGGIVGSFRQPQMVLIYGDADTETEHVENTVRFRLDPQKIMFSSGNLDERKRMGSIAQEGEQVVDLFAGIGYFSIPMALFSIPKKIVACEINPIAFRYLSENIMINDVPDIVQPVLGDNRKMAPKQWADRVLLGHFGNTKTYLPIAFRALKKSGGVIHFHDVFPKESVSNVPFSELSASARTYFKKVDLLSWHIIKSFAPGIVHVVLDVGVR